MFLLLSFTSFMFHYWLHFEENHKRIIYKVRESRKK